MKKIPFLVLFCIFIASNPIAQPSWNLQPNPVEEDLVSICFTDDSNGWIVSAEGSILHTADGGVTWDIQSFPEYRFAAVHFSGANHGFAVGWGAEPVQHSIVMKTTDGGSSWTIAGDPGVTRLNDVFFWDSSTGWVVGTYDDLIINACLHTSDGGDNWTLQSAPGVSEAELFGVHFRNELIGVVCGANGAFLHTNNGGVTSWALNISMPLVNLNAVWNSGSLDGCCVGDDGTILYTINNWYQHIEQVSGTTEDLLGVHAPPGLNKYWAVGRNGTILHTSNYILGWTFQDSGTSGDLNDVWMVTETLGWAVGANGTLLKYSTGTGVSPSREALSVSVSPNPARGATKVVANSNRPVERIEVINIFGQLNETLSPAGERKEFTLDLSGLHQGIYFLKMYSGQEFVIRRIVVCD